jgi:hypothetical protein
MYIFTSAIFFLIFFSLFDVRNKHIPAKTMTEIQKDRELRELMTGAKNAADSLKILNKYNSNATPLITLDEDSSSTKRNGIRITPAKPNYETVESYDSAQKTFPEDKRDGWIKHKITTRKIQVSQQFEKNPGGTIRELLSNFMHNFPKALFISLPLFALILKLLYIRKKNFYYVDHGIFSVHLYIFSFLLLLISFGLGELSSITHWGLIVWLQFALWIYALIYYYKAMRRFYGQGRGKTILKYLLLFFLSSFVQITIFALAAIYTVVES